MYQTSCKIFTCLLTIVSEKLSGKNTLAIKQTGYQNCEQSIQGIRKGGKITWDERRWSNISGIKGLQASRNERKTVAMDQALMNSSLSEKEWEKKTFPTFFLSELFQVPWLQPAWGGNLLICCRHLTKGQFSTPRLADFYSNCREVGVPTLLEAWVGSIHMPALAFSFQAGKSVIEPNTVPIFC